MLRVGYDIRGIYGEDIDEELAYRVGLRVGGAGNVIVGHDARRGSVSLYRAVVDGVIDAGGSALAAGLVTTPVLVYAAKGLATDAAVMVTASHNPPEYNGFKLFGRDGLPLSMDQMRSFWRSLDAVDRKEGGTLARVDAWGLYADALSRRFPRTDASILLDSGNGVGALYGDVLRRFVRVVHVRPDIHPGFPDRGPEPTHDRVSDLVDLLRNGAADLAIATDGDGDRVVIVDEQGVIPSYQLLHAFYRALGGPVVASIDIPPMFLPNGENVYRAPVGTSNIVSMALDVGARFSAEMSGHFTAYDFSYSSDPIYFGLLALQTEVLRPEIPRIPHVTKSYRISDPGAAMSRLRSSFPVVSEIDGVELSVDGHWVLVRPSNTEPKLRVSVAGPEPRKVLGILERVIFSGVRTSLASQGAPA